MALGSLNELFSLPFVDSFKIEVKEKLDANACQVIFSAQFTFYNFRWLLFFALSGWLSTVCFTALLKNMLIIAEFVIAETIIIIYLT